MYAELSPYDNLVVVGGDGFFQEARLGTCYAKPTPNGLSAHTCRQTVTGLFQRSPTDPILQAPVGLIPAGTSNNLARRLANPSFPDRRL
jgi:diacylglycerol kinase family enzyme